MPYEIWRWFFISKTGTAQAVKICEAERRR